MEQMDESELDAIDNLETGYRRRRHVSTALGTAVVLGSVFAGWKYFLRQPPPFVPCLWHFLDDSLRLCGLAEGNVPPRSL